MKTIKKGIVFSNDIQNILNGYNAINYSYSQNGMIIPNKETIEELRNNFKKTVNKIFLGNTTIITEEEMQNSIQYAISDILNQYPHCISR